MGLVKGGFQRLFQTLLYFILWLCAAIILGIYSYFLSVLADRNLHIPTWEKAVEGIAGAAVLYLIFATLLTCCLGGITGLAIMGIVLDLFFCAGMIAIAVLTRHGAGSCKGNVNTPLGTGPASNDNGFGKGGFGSNSSAVYSVHLGLACELNTVCFAVSLIAAVLFICTAVMQVLLMRHHKKEKRYGPSPKNNYTSGTGSRFGFGKKKGAKGQDTELGDAQPDNRVSHETGYTGTTVGGPGYDAYNKTETAAPHGAHGGYYTAPTGTTAQNPYGYNNTSTNY